MYLDHEKEKIHGWGHSLISEALNLAKDATVKHLILFYHDPSRTDEELDKIGIQARQWMEENYPEGKVSVAKEADEYLL